MWVTQTLGGLLQFARSVRVQLLHFGPANEVLEGHRALRRVLGWSGVATYPLCVEVLANERCGVAMSGEVYLWP